MGQGRGDGNRPPPKFARPSLPALQPLGRHTLATGLTGLSSASGARGSSQGKAHQKSVSAPNSTNRETEASQAELKGCEASASQQRQTVCTWPRGGSAPTAGKMAFSASRTKKSESLASGQGKTQSLASKRDRAWSPKRPCVSAGEARAGQRPQQPLASSGSGGQQSRVSREQPRAPLQQGEQQEPPVVIVASDDDTQLVQARGAAQQRQQARATPVVAEVVKWPEGYHPFSQVNKEQCVRFDGSRWFPNPPQQGEADKLGQRLTACAIEVNKQLNQAWLAMQKNLAEQLQDLEEGRHNIRNPRTLEKKKKELLDKQMPAVCIPTAPGRHTKNGDDDCIPGLEEKMRKLLKMPAVQSGKIDRGMYNEDFEDWDDIHGWAKMGLADVEEHPSMKVHVIPKTDERKALRGGYGVVASEAIEKYTVLGPYRGVCYSDDEESCMTQPPLPDDFMPFEWEQKCEEYGHDHETQKLSSRHGESSPHIKQLQEHLKKLRYHDGFRLLYNATAVGNLTALVNDPSIKIPCLLLRSHRFNVEYTGEGNVVKAADGSPLFDNCTLMDVFIHGFPVPFMVAVDKVLKGSELAYAYGEGYWNLQKSSSHHVRTERSTQARTANTFCRTTLTEPTEGQAHTRMQASKQEGVVDERLAGAGPAESAESVGNVCADAHQGPQEEEEEVTAGHRARASQVQESVGRDRSSQPAVPGRAGTSSHSGQASRQNAAEERPSAMLEEDVGQLREADDLAAAGDDEDGDGQVTWTPTLSVQLSALEYVEDNCLAVELYCAWLNPSEAIQMGMAAAGPEGDSGLICSPLAQLMSDAACDFDTISLSQMYKEENACSVDSRSRWHLLQQLSGDLSMDDMNTRGVVLGMRARRGYGVDEDNQDNFNALVKLLRDRDVALHVHAVGKRNARGERDDLHLLIMAWDQLLEEELVESPRQLVDALDLSNAAQRKRQLLGLLMPKDYHKRSLAQRLKLRMSDLEVVEEEISRSKRRRRAKLAGIRREEAQHRTARPGRVWGGAEGQRQSGYGLSGDWRRPRRGDCWRGDPRWSDGDDGRRSGPGGSGRDWGGHVYGWAPVSLSFLPPPACMGWRQPDRPPPRTSYDHRDSDDDDEDLPPPPPGPPPAHARGQNRSR